MTRRTLLSAPVLLSPCASPWALRAAGEWQALFDGTSLSGWRANENPDSFQLRDGAIVARGKPRSHLFYSGPIAGARFTDFELEVEVKSEPNSNGGIYFHTAFQPSGWPEKGFEVQINNTYKDRRKTGSLYGVQDVFEAPAQDGEWFTERISVRGKRVVVAVNGRTVVDWTQPADWQGLNVRKRGQPYFPERKLASGTFALQAHDPGSLVLYRNIRVRLSS